jgi:hypothetical protein
MEKCFLLFFVELHGFIKTSSKDKNLHELYDLKKI